MDKNISKEEHVIGAHGHGFAGNSLSITGWLTGVYFFIELVLGFYSGSISVISDAFHTFSAVGGVLLAIIASRIALKPSDKFKSFGLLRAEIVGALLNGFFLLIMAVFVFYMGWMRLSEPIAIPTLPMFVAAIGGLITEIISIKLLYSGQKDNLNMRGAFWHVLQTFVGSVIIIVAAIIIKFTGFLAIDPILGMLFGLVLLYASWSIIRDAFQILLEYTPPEIDLHEIQKYINALEGVDNVHHIHSWVLTSGKNIFSSHIKIKENADPEIILKKVNKILKEKYDFYFSTLQVEKDCEDINRAQDIDIS